MIYIRIYCIHIGLNDFLSYWKTKIIRITYYNEAVKLNEAALPHA